ncbi:MAG: hypothetical protein Tsb009_20760 [Planctomycetaceae bacterium]
MTDPQVIFEKFEPRSAWQAYYPLGSNPWDLRKVGHLYRRAAFGGSWKSLQSGLNSSPTQLVEQLLQGGSGQREFERVSEEQLDIVMRSQDPRQLKAWWIYRMLHSPHPLKERMTLFWHNHFATSNAKVDNLWLMQRQHDSLRKHALGNFGELLQEMTRDPAMILWLDSNTNKKGRPNENYAREIFELFSLGVGNYTEDDIQQAARALTGWDVRDGRAVFNPADFDTGRKTIFGRTGNWAAGDVVRIILEQPACSRFLTRKLIREFVGETITVSNEMLEPLASQFRIRNYDIAWLVEQILKSWVFYSDAAILQKVKSPVDFLAGTVRMLEGQVGPEMLADLCDELGQSLFYPPSVKGWDGSDDWINSTTLLSRQNIARKLTSGESEARGCDPATLVSRHRVQDDEAVVEFFLQLFLQNPAHDSRTKILDFARSERRRLRAMLYSSEIINQRVARSIAHLVLTLPEFQLA